MATTDKRCLNPACENDEPARLYPQGWWHTECHPGGQGPKVDPSFSALAYELAHPKPKSKPRRKGQW